jgi:NADH-quinone oxidoreductase subunit A
MTDMPNLVLFILIFLAAGATILAANLVLGWLIRPNKPNAEKGEVYECGEQPVGSPWVQFDMRFYVVALLFVIFDVELAFFFPWAVVFGTANQLAEPGLTVGQQIAIEKKLETPAATTPHPSDLHPAAAKRMAWIAFADILVFFGVLLVGFAYLWRRGDLNWVRSTVGQSPSPATAAPVEQ